MIRGGRIVGSSRRTRMINEPVNVGGEAGTVFKIEGTSFTGDIRQKFGGKHV